MGIGMMISEAIAIKTGCTVAEGAARIWFVDSKGLVSALHNSSSFSFSFCLPFITSSVTNARMLTILHYIFLLSFDIDVQITNARTDELAHHKLPFAHNPPAPSSGIMDDGNYYP